MNQGFLRKWSKVKPTSFSIASRGGELAEVERRLALADVAVGLEQHPRVERLLVAEVVVEHALVGAGPLGDPVDARAVEAVLDELLACGHQDVALGPRRVARPSRRPAPARRLRCRSSGLRVALTAGGPRNSNRRCYFPGNGLRRAHQQAAARHRRHRPPRRRHLGPGCPGRLRRSRWSWSGSATPIRRGSPWSRTMLGLAGPAVSHRPRRHARRGPAAYAHRLHPRRHPCRHHRAGAGARGSTSSPRSRWRRRPRTAGASSTPRRGPGGGWTWRSTTASRRPRGRSASSWPRGGSARSPRSTSTGISTPSTAPTTSAAGMPTSGIRAAFSCTRRRITSTS